MAKIIDFLREGDSKRLTKVLNEVNQELKTSLHASATSPFSGTALSRHLLYYAMVLWDGAGSAPAADDESDVSPQTDALGTVERANKKRSKTLASFSRLREAYQAFYGVVGAPANLLLINEVGTDDLEAFCHFTTRRRGTKKPLMYASLLLFVIYLYQIKALEHATFKTLVPESEKKLAQRCEAAISRLYEHGEPDDRSRLKAYGAVDVRFWYGKHQIEELERFVRQFQIAEDSCAHFVVYRSRRSNPRQLMKSFLAFKPPWAPGPDGEPMNSSSYNFTHIYAPPEGRLPLRISNGKLVPLDGGLYCVGGQKDLPLTETVPFKTLKTIAIDWTVIERRDFIFPALAMSANFDGEHLLSRAYIRATPIAKSEDITLGAVSISELRDDLEEDFRIERAKEGVTDHPGRFLFSQQADAIDAYVADIINKTNNNPSKGAVWDVAEGIENKEKTKILTRAGVESRLEDAFPLREYSHGEPPKSFSFWSDIRFGPLVND